LYGQGVKILLTTILHFDLDLMFKLVLDLMSHDQSNWIITSSFCAKIMKSKKRKQKGQNRNWTNWREIQIRQAPKTKDNDLLAQNFFSQSHLVNLSSTRGRFYQQSDYSNLKEISYHNIISYYKPLYSKLLHPITMNLRCTSNAIIKVAF